MKNFEGITPSTLALLNRNIISYFTFALVKLPREMRCTGTIIITMMSLPNGQTIALKQSHRRALHTHQVLEGFKSADLCTSGVKLSSNKIDIDAPGRLKGSWQIHKISAANPFSTLQCTNLIRHQDGKASL